MFSIGLRSGSVPVFFYITGVRCDFIAGLWDFSPNVLLRLIVVRFKFKIEVFLVGALWRAHDCLAERSSLGVDFHGRYETCHQIEFNHSILHFRLDAIQFSSNTPFCESSFM